MEILIVIGVLAVIGASVPITLNYKTQIDKGNNTKIKNELATIQRAFENFYNDKKRYPKPEEICFDTPSNEVYLDDRGNRSKICHICGTKISHTSYPNLKNYLSNVPCHPNSSRFVGTPESIYRDYIYSYDIQDAAPQYYRIYAKLNTKDDPGTIESGCTRGCGPLYDEDNHKIFDEVLTNNNYAISSPNIPVEGDAQKCVCPRVYFRAKTSGTEQCDIITESLCTSFPSTNNYFSDGNCRIPCFPP